MHDKDMSDLIGRVPDKVLLRIQDAVTTDGVASLVLEATHSAVLNLNERFYSPIFMKNGADSFVSPKKKPVLVNHDLSSPPLGRVHKAEYVNIANKYKDSALTKLNKKVLSAKRIDSATRFSYDLYVALNDSGMLEDYGKSYFGMGYLRLFANIGDQTAIERINDGRYDTVSVSFRPVKGAHCLECNCQMGSDDCDHSPFWNSAPLMPIGHNYIEVSFVNAGADILAGQEEDNSNNDEYCYDTIFSDSIMGDTIVLTTGKDMKVGNLDKKDNKPLENDNDDISGDDVNNHEDDAANEEDNNEPVVDENEERHDSENSEDSVDDADVEADGDAADDASSAPNEDDGEDDNEDSEDSADNDGSSGDIDDADKKHIMSVIDETKFVTSYNDFVSENLDDEYLLTEDDLASDDINYLGPNKTFGVVRKVHIDGMKQFLAGFKGTGVDVILEALDSCTVDKHDDAEFSLADIDGLSPDVKQSIFDHLYDECAGNNEKHQELSAQILFHKYSSDSANKEAEAAENMYKDLFEKARSLIVQYITDKKIAVGEINESETDEYKEKLIAEKNDKLLEMFDLFKSIDNVDNTEDGDNESEQEDGPNEDIDSDSENINEQEQGLVIDKADIFRHLSTKVGKQKAVILMTGLEEINRRIN